MQLLSVEAQEIQFQLEVFVERYRNQNHRNADGGCCSGRGRDCNNLPCNNHFIFCTGPSGQASVDTGTCPYGMFNFTIANDDIEVPFTATASATFPGSQVKNPIAFQRNEGWTVSV